MSVFLYTANPWFVLAFGCALGALVGSLVEGAIRWGRAKWHAS